MMRRLLIVLLALGLGACTLQHEEPMILEEPVFEEEIAREGDLDCEFGDEDGIGGTGCEPVARKLPGL